MKPRRVPALHSRSCWIRSLLLLACLAAGPAAQAVEVEDLYEARAPTEGQGEDERRDAFREALADVIIRVTGDSQAPDNADVEPLLEDAEDYVQSYRYRERGDDDEDDDAADYDLAVSFDGGRIESDLEEADVAVWGPRRPELLLWVGVDEGRERYIVGEEDGAAARDVLRDQAGERGLPVLFPLLDVEDRDRIEFIDVRAPFLEAVEDASERYRPDNALVGHVRRRGSDDWTAEWTLIAEDEETAWRVRGDDRDDLLGAGIDGATDRLAARLAGRESELIDLFVNVEGLDAVGDYARVQQYLDTRGRVNSAEVDRVSSTAARFRVEFEGSLAELQRTLALGDVLDAAVSARLANELVSDSEEADEAVALDSLVDEILGEDPDALPAARDDDAGDGDDDDEDGEDADERERIEIFYRFAG